MRKESMRDKKNEESINRMHMNTKMNRETIYPSSGGTKKTSPNRVRFDRARIKNFLCLFIFSS
jgi:hypothetical protein